MCKIRPQSQNVQLERSHSKRGGKRRNLSATIKKCISTFPAGLTFDAPAFNVHGQRRNSHTVSQAEAAKLEDGNVRAAVRILISAESPSVPSDASLSNLREKTPSSLCKSRQSACPTTGQQCWWSISQRSVGQFSRFQPALLEALIFCARSIYAT